MLPSHDYAPKECKSMYAEVCFHVYGAPQTKRTETMVGTTAGGITILSDNHSYQILTGKMLAANFFPECQARLCYHPFGERPSIIFWVSDWGKSWL